MPARFSKRTFPHIHDGHHTHNHFSGPKVSRLCFPFICGTAPTLSAPLYFLSSSFLSFLIFSLGWLLLFVSCFFLPFPSAIWSEENNKETLGPYGSMMRSLSSKIALRSLNWFGVRAIRSSGRLAGTPLPTILQSLSRRFFTNVNVSKCYGETKHTRVQVYYRIFFSFWGVCVCVVRVLLFGLSGAEKNS